MGAFISLLISWRGSATIKPGIYFSSSPAVLQVKGSSSLTFPAFLETRCKSLSREFKPAWWLLNGHLQTIYAVIGNFSKIDKVAYERHLLRTPDGGTLGLDFTTSQHEGLDPETPIVVVMHGLTGGSYESYVRSVLSFACAPKALGGLGYRGIVVNFRGCAGVEITSPQFYSGGYTDDLRIALLYISNLYPHAKLMGVGFSLGANVMTRYLGEEGEASRLVSACVLGCPWDLVANSDRLEGNWLSRLTYSRAMGNNIRALVRRHLPSLSRLGPSIITPHLEPLLSTTKGGLIVVDDQLTRLIGGSSPPFPFPSVRAYYTWASSHRQVEHIKKPFLAINALDDPIVKCIPLPVPAEANCTAIVVTRHGGHLGWFQRNKRSGQWHVERWIREPVCEWLQAVGEDLMIEIEHGNDVEKVDGFIRDIGNHKIGYREVGMENIAADAGATGILAGL